MAEPSLFNKLSSTVLYMLVHTTKMTGNFFFSSTLKYMSSDMFLLSFIRNALGKIENPENEANEAIR